MPTLDYYYFPWSYWSRIVSLVLADKGLEPRRHFVDIRKNLNFEPAYVRLNPKGVVPTMVVDGRAICNSPRIVAALDDLAGPASRTPEGEDWARRLESVPMMLLSYSVWIRGRKGEHSAEILADKIERASRYAETYPDLRAVYLRKQAFFRTFQARVRDEAQVAAHKEAARETIDDMGAAVAGGAWLAGPRFGFADAIAASILYRLADLEIVDHWRTTAHPAHAYYERLRALPAFCAVFDDDPLMSE
jgi:glutathione S-transferase